MQRYFFDINRLSGGQPDDVGVYLENAAAANQAGLNGLADLIRERLAEVNLGDITMEVRDESGNIVMQVSVVFRQEFRNA